jgi:peptide/nickel transport system substrate-binding protein
VPTTSNDIAYTWRLEVDPNFPASASDVSLKVAGIDTPDDHTAVVRYMSASQARDASQHGAYGLDAKRWADYKDRTEPLTDSAYFLPPLADEGLWLPAHILSQIPADQQQASAWAARPIGNGPYTVVDAEPDQSITLQAIDNYFLGKPLTSTVIFRLIPDTTAQLGALQAGEIDVQSSVNGLDVDAAPQLDQLQGYTTFYVPGPSWEHIDLNLTYTVLQDPNVRKGLIESIDRQQIIDIVMSGKTRLLTSWMQRGTLPWLYDETCPTLYRYDPDEAARLFQQAGYARGSDGVLSKDDQPLTLTLFAGDSNLIRSIAQLLQTQLADVGLQLDLELQPLSTLFSARDGALVRGTYDLAMYAWNPGLPQDPDVATLYNSIAFPSPANNLQGQNYPRYNNPQFEQLMLQAANSSSVNNRKALYCQAVRMWSDDLPVVPLFDWPIVTVARTTLANYRPTPSGTPDTWNIWAWFMQV